MANSILTPGYLRWDGLKFVFDPNVTVVDEKGPPGAAGPPGPQGPVGPSGGGGGNAGADSRAVNYKSFKYNPESNAARGVNNDWITGVFNGFESIHDADTNNIAGRDLIVLGDYLYVAGNAVFDTATGVASIFQFDINNPEQVNIFNVPSGDIPYNLTGYRDFDFDKILSITPTNLSLFKFGREISGQAPTTDFSYSGDFTNSRGVIATSNPDDNDGAVIWTKPSANLILAADPYGGDVSPITAYTPSVDEGTPHAICVDTETHQVWISFIGGSTNNLQKFSMNFDTKQLTRLYKLDAVTADDLLFDGSNVWAWDQTGGVVRRFSSAGDEQSSYTLSSISFQTNTKGRMAFDGNVVYLSLAAGAIAKMHPATGAPCGELFSGGFDYRGISIAENKDIFVAVHNSDVGTLLIKRFIYNPDPGKVESVFIINNNSSFNYVEPVTNSVKPWDVIILGDTSGSESPSTVILPGFYTTNIPSYNQKITVKDGFGFASVHNITVISKLSGNTASIVNNTFVGPGGFAITGLNNITPGAIGQAITISGAADTNNNGSFIITGDGNGSSNIVQYNNPSGSHPDANNGSISWQIGSSIIENTDKYVINRDFGSATFLWDGGIWHVVSSHAPAGASAGSLPLSTVLYVDIGTTAPTSNGAINAPYATLTDAVTAGASIPFPGPTLMLTAGAYNETVTLLSPGNPPISWWINGFETASPNLLNTSILEIDSAGGTVSLSNININTLTCGSLFLNRSLLAFAGTITVDFTVEASNCFFTGGSLVGLTFDSANIFGSTINCNVHAGGTTIYLERCRFDNTITITFTEGAGTLKMDSITRFNWDASGSSLVNGSISMVYAIS